MKNRSILSIILLCLVLNSCNESPEAHFNKEGISLTSPTGWNISDEENLDNEGYYLSIEKDGLDSSGLLTITWLNGELGLLEWLEIYKDEMKSNLVYKNSNLEFSEPQKSYYHKFPTQVVKFTASIIGVKHEGEIHAFHEKGKTISVLKQEAREDKNDNYQGFKLIEESFKVE